VIALRRGVALAGLVLASGCAQRGLASGPSTGQGAGTWVAVALAAAAAALVLSALVVVPAWRPGGSGFAAGLLALQAGATVVGGAVLVGSAIRSGQLADRPAEAEQAVSLIRLTGIDGDADFFRTMAVLALVLGLLLVAVLVLAARFAAGADPVERTLACCLLAVEALLAGVAVVLGLLGHRSLPFALTAATLPVLVLAIVKCWPHREADERQLGYNGGHG